MIKLAYTRRTKWLLGFFICIILMSAVYSVGMRCPAQVNMIRDTDWKSLTVSFFVNESSKSIKYNLTIDDPQELRKLQSKFVIYSWSHTTLHTLSWWNRLHIRIDENDKGEMLVITGHDDMCLYGKNRTPIQLQVSPIFYFSLLEIIRHRYGTKANLIPENNFSGKQINFFDMKMDNQEPLLVPTDDSWAEVLYKSKTLNQFYKELAGVSLSVPVQ